MTDLWEAATRDLRELVANEGPAAWEYIYREYDQYSLREFLVMKGFSEGAIEAYGVMNFVEADMNNAVVEELREDLGRNCAGHAGDRRRHGSPARRVLRRAAGPHPVRRGGPRDRPGPDIGDGPLQDRGWTLCGHGRLRDVRDPVLGPAPRRGPDPVLAREAAGDPAAQLLGQHEDPVPGAGAHLGGRTGSSAGRPSPTCRSVA